MVHGSVSALRQLRFRKCMTKSSVYTLSGLDVMRSSPKFRLSEAPVSIRFNDGTAFDKLTTTVRTIPTENFGFRPYDQILPGIIIFNLSMVVSFSCHSFT